MQDLDYAEMLEIPAGTVTVTKKRSFFRRREQPREDLKERVVDSVNERVGAYVEGENLSDPPQKQSGKSIKFGRDRESTVLFCEMAAVCLIAMAIFLTNIFMPNSAINTFISSLVNPTKEVAEPQYNELTLSSVVGANSAADVVLADNGILSFTAEGAVYPVCDGTVASVTAAQNDTYVVKISHTSDFTSVITGLTNVYSGVGEKVCGNLPFAYSSGENEVTVSLYSGEELLSGITLSGAVPVWKQ